MSQINFPAIHAPVYLTPGKVPYLRNPGVVNIAQPITNIDGLAPFLGGFDHTLQFGDYLNDETPIDDAAKLCKVAGQTCYLSFGPKRSKNDQASKYFHNIKSSSHGSILEHANFTFLFYGIDRSVTHELVRHRAGMGYSMVSQRYVNGTVLRFVERPEYQDHPELHQRFETYIDNCAREYDLRAQMLAELQLKKDPALSTLSPTDRRKQVNQAARSCLPNETEAPIIVTGNVRAWRHFCEMRCSPHADFQIRALAGKLMLCLVKLSPILFEDYSLEMQKDGFPAATTEYKKV